MSTGQSAVMLCGWEVKAGYGSFHSCEWQVNLCDPSLTRATPSVLEMNIALITRKHRQSYRHADPRRQQQHTAVAARVTSNRATVRVFVTV